MSKFKSVMQQASSITVDTRSLKKGIHPFVFSPTPESLDLDRSRFRGISVDGSLSIATSGMVVSMSVDAVATLECDRTLVDFEQSISGSFEGIVADASAFDMVDGETGSQVDSLRKADSPQKDGALDEGGIDENGAVPMVEGVVVLDRVVRDTLLLAIPMRKISPDAAALEIQLEYGAKEGDLDPRWEALRALKSDGPDEEMKPEEQSGGGAKADPDDQQAE